MSSQEYVDIAVAKPIKPDSPGDIENQQQSLLLPNAQGSSSWGNATDMEAVLRRGFLKKVYGILSVQMLVTVGIVALFMLDADVKNYTQQNTWVMWTAMGFYLFTAFTIICCGELRRKHPHGLILLSITTISLSVMVAIISCTYDTYTVMYAGIITAGTTLGLSAYACTTKRDFTMMGGALVSFLWVMIFSSFLFWWFPPVMASQTWNIVYGGIGAFLMCLFIVYDTQLMLGGKHKYSISMDEYVFAALNLYLDIINLFLYLLRVVGGGRGK